MTDYNLTFFCKETKQEFKGKRSNAPGRYLLIHPVTNEKIDLSTHSLTKKFIKSRQNKKAAVKRTPWMKPLFRKPNTKAFREYMGEAV